MARKRDDFSISTIEKLRSRVGGRCSNPDCRVPTTGPTEDPEKVNNIGVAAHITAAAPGGPRYDRTLSANQRKSITNAIWLCSNCSRNIDNNSIKYSVKKLNHWKILAEKKADSELGTKLPDNNYVINSISSVLNGQSEIFLPTIISNAHLATSRALEMLDSRFTVNTRFNDGRTKFEIHANEHVTTQIKINPAYAKEFIEKYTNLENHGDKLTIDSSAFTISGSPLLENITNNLNGKFEISPSQKKEAVIHVWLVEPNSISESNLNDFLGTAVLGKKSMTTKGTSLNGLASMAIRIVIADFIPAGGTFSFDINFEKWDKLPLARIPYFNKIYELYSKISNGWKMHFSLEIEGLEIAKGFSADFSSQETFEQTLSHMNFIRAAKGIADLLDKPLVYDNSFEYSSEFNLRINEIYQILSEGISVSHQSLQGNATCNLEASEDLSNIKTIINSEGKPMSLRIDQVEAEHISFFNQNVILPRFSHRLTEVMPKIKNEVECIVAGDLVKVEWIPTENCQYIIEKYSQTLRAPLLSIDKGIRERN